MYPNDTTQEIPYGYCHCGCGEKTKIAKASNKGYGYVRGEPIRFIHGHHPYRPPIKRFWEYVDKRGDDECWLWTGPIHKAGYGVLNLSRPHKAMLAHRFSFELHYGPIPDELDCLHRCDNPPCVNPAHLFTGTALDNVKDMDAKGRRVNGVSAGEVNGFAKLVEDDVRAIRQRFAQGESRFSLADAYGVDHTNIWLIVQRKTWRHVE